MHTRRDFLKTTAGLVSLGVAAPAFLTRAAAAAETRGETILVVLELPGGNDGLNTVVPYEDDHYHRARPTLRLTGKQVHKIDDRLGLHPQLAAFRRLLEEGTLSIVQSVGYSPTNDGHPQSIQIWHTADLDLNAGQTGWLGRVVDRVTGADEAVVPALFVGPERPLALHTEKAVVPAVQRPDEIMLRGMPGSEKQIRGRLVSAAGPPRGQEAGGLLEFVRRSALAAYDGRIEAAAVRGRGGAYPPLVLAGKLQGIAQLIRAELGVRIFYTELAGGGIGGFDTHAGQALNHGALLNQLSESVAAFVDDLKHDGLLDRVLLMTCSEFGRTVAENGRRGTDHGAAAPVFLAGGRLKARLVGPYPDLTDIEGTGLRPHNDFRRLYATVLDGWLGVDSQAVLGRKFEPLEVLRG